MLAMSLNFALVQKKTKASQSLKIKAKASVNMWVIFHNNDILKDL